MSKVKYLSAKETRDLGVLHEINRRMLHPVGLCAIMDINTGQIRIMDQRADPEGVRYDVLQADKVQAYEKLCEQRYRTRHAHLGYIVQPLTRQDAATLYVESLADAPVQTFQQEPEPAQEDECAERNEAIMQQYRSQTL